MGINFWVVWKSIVDYDVTEINTEFCRMEEEAIEFINQPRFKEENHDYPYEYNQVLSVFKGEKLEIKKEKVEVVVKYGLKPVVKEG